MKFFTSDTHFNHERILSLGDGRPFESIERHNMELVNNWNTVVMPWDTVYHLGDVALGPWPLGLKYLAMCNGTKVLVPGNHDRVSAVEKVARRERFLPDYLGVFDAVVSDVTATDVGGRWVMLSHYPYEGDSHDGDRFEHIRAADRGMPMVHGHTHCGPDERESFTDKGTPQFSVGVDANDWTPVPETTITEWLTRVS